jgi:uracil phosphoribosyltransferase
MLGRVLYISQGKGIADSPAATGGSAIKAVEVLIEHGVPEERIIFVNLVCIPNLT